MRTLALPLFLLSTLPACWTVTHEYHGQREITPGTSLSQPSTKLGEVDDWKKATFLFWGLLPLNSDTASGPDVVERAAVQGYGHEFDGITRVKIEEEQSAIDVVVQILTVGLFSMVTVEVDADVEQFVGGRS